MVKQMEQKRMNTRKANIAVRQNSPLLFRGVIAHRKKSDDQKTIGPSSKAGLYALRFFAAMVLLTLLARGTSGATMARVELQVPTVGAILQQTTVSATILSWEGQNVFLPEGVMVDYLAVSEGQSLKSGDTILQLNIEELQDTLDSTKAQLGQQKAQYANLTSTSTVDSSGVSSAQEALNRATQDYDRSTQKAQIAVDDAVKQQQKAQQEYDEAIRILNDLQNQPQSVSTPEQAQLNQKIEEAKQQVEIAEDTLASANTALRDAKLSQEDAIISAQRNVENAQDTLNQSQADYNQAKENADLAAQTNAADAVALNLEIQKCEDKIQNLEELIESDGVVTATYDTQVLLCSLQQGQPCPAGSALRLADENGQKIVQFSLKEEDASKTSIGQTVSVKQGQKTVQTTVQTIAPPDENGNCLVTVVLPQENTPLLSTDTAAQAEITFSRNEYSNCLPTSAIRQDSEGSFILTVEQSQSVFGVTNLAVRTPVTVLEIGSDGQYAAIAERGSGQVIVSSDRAVSPGSSVRIDS